MTQAPQMTAALMPTGANPYPDRSRMREQTGFGVGLLHRWNPQLDSYDGRLPIVTFYNCGQCVPSPSLDVTSVFGGRLASGGGGSLWRL
jgi:hypothetical protein